MQLPVYFINLDARPDRLSFITDQTFGVGIAAQRISAVGAADISGRLPKGWHRTAGEYACTMSHAIAWRTLLASSAEAAVVLEDDAVLAKDFADIIDDSTPQLAGRPDLIKLETRLGRYFVGRERGRSGRYAFRRLLTQHYGTCGYIISRRGARRALSLIEEYDKPVDWFLFSTEGPMLLKSRVHQLLPGACVAADVKAHADHVGKIADSDLESARQILPHEKTFSRTLFLMHKWARQLMAGAADLSFPSKREVRFADE